MNLSGRTLLCKCTTIEKRNEIIADLSRNNIPFEKKIKREKFSFKNINFKEGKFDVFYIVYVSKNDLEKAKNILKENNIEAE